MYCFRSHVLGFACVRQARAIHIPPDWAPCGCQGIYIRIHFLRGTAPWQRIAVHFSATFAVRQHKRAESESQSAPLQEFVQYGICRHDTRIRGWYP